MNRLHISLRFLTSQRSSKRRILKAPTVLVGAFAVSVAIAGDAQPAYPGQLHGIWFNDNIEGFAQCRAYLGVDNSDNDEISSHLVGAVLISGSMMHNYAEYGEGNFYELRTLEKNRRNSWRARAAVGIDAMPGSSQPAEETFHMTLRGAKLTIASKPTPLDLSDGRRPFHKLYRCADLPSFAD